MRSLHHSRPDDDVQIHIREEPTEFHLHRILNIHPILPIRPIADMDDHCIPEIRPNHQYIYLLIFISCLINSRNESIQNHSVLHYAFEDDSLETRKTTLISL